MPWYKNQIRYRPHHGSGTKTATEIFEAKNMPEAKNRARGMYPNVEKVNSTVTSKP